ncbi:MAG: peptidylprolyl isomerase [Desulfuromonadales bacterium]
MNSCRKSFGIFLIFLLFATLAACQKKPEPSPVLLRVDERAITLEEFQHLFAKSLPAEQKLSPEEKSHLERSYLVQLVDRELAIAEAGRLGIAVAPEEVEAALREHRSDYPGDAFEEMLSERGITLADWRRELEEGLRMEKVVRQTVYPGITVREEEIEQFFTENRKEFDRPLQVRARQIVVASEEEGLRILGLLRQGQSFVELARQHSLSPDSDEGGDLGFFARGEMPAEFEAAVFNLPVGRISELVKSEYGHHIFLVEKRREAVRLKLGQVREEIRAGLQAEKEENAYQQWLQNLRGKATIDIDWSLL